MSTITTPLSGPHTHAQRSTGQIMALVTFALLPATAFGFYLFGWPAFNLWLLTIVSALLSEAVTLWIARKPVLFYLGDGSALLSAWLLAMTLPPWAPWWIAVMGGVIAIVLGKQVFGGIGQNLFNPAMLARVVLLISFPVELTSWVTPQVIGGSTSPSFIEGLMITFRGYTIDTVSSASVLGHVRTEVSAGHHLSTLMSQMPSPEDMGLGFMSGSMGETSAAFIIMGGIFLIYKRIITWHIPAAMLASTALLAMIMHGANPERYVGAGFHLTAGGIMLGAFFIATDLVTSPSTPLGKIIFGAGCGGLVYVIRTWGGYPEGVAFAVMLMNAMTPLIDHYIRPRIYGHKRRGVSLTYSGKRLESAHKFETKND